MMKEAKTEQIPLRNDGGNALEPAALPPVREEGLVGRVIEVGDIECLQDESGVPKAGLLIETTQEALRAFLTNLAFAEVVITNARLDRQEEAR